MDAAGEGVGDVAVDRDLPRALIDLRDFIGAATGSIGQDQDQTATGGAALGSPRTGGVLPVVRDGVILDGKVGELKGAKIGWRRGHLGGRGQVAGDQVGASAGDGGGDLCLPVDLRLEVRVMAIGTDTGPGIQGVAV